MAFDYACTCVMQLGKDHRVVKSQVLRYDKVLQLLMYMYMYVRRVMATQLVMCFAL